MVSLHLESMITGAAGGLVATAPMTVVMNTLHEHLPAEEARRTSPQRVTDEALRKFGAERHLDEEKRRVAALLAHYGVGAAAGALYGVIKPRSLWASAAAGVGYGLCVYAAGYLGLLPAFGLHRSARKENEQWKLEMIAAHVVWGLAAGIGATLLGRAERLAP